MDQRKEKIERYYAYLTSKRDLFTHNLTRIGVKLMNLSEGDYDLDHFLKSLVPSHHFLKNKIEQEFRDSQISLCPDQATRGANGISDFDSRFIEAMKSEIKELDEDFMNLLENTEVKESVSHEKKKSDQEYDSDNLHQIINPGEMSKIFIQKSGVNVVRSKTDKPNFNDDNLETIYIYRSKKS